MLDVLPPGELAQAVAREDRAAVGRANGVGPKLAQRIVVELKDKPLSGPFLSGELRRPVPPNRRRPPAARSPPCSASASRRSPRAGWSIRPPCVSATAPVRPP